MTKTLVDAVSVVRGGTRNFSSHDNPEIRLAGMADIVEITFPNALGERACEAMDRIQRGVEERKESGRHLYIFDQDAMYAGGLAVLSLAEGYDAPDPIHEYIHGMSRYGAVPRRIIKNLVEDIMSEPVTERNSASHEIIFTHAVSVRATYASTRLLHRVGSAYRRVMSASVN